MPKKPKINKRLDKLFKNFQPEDSASQPTSNPKVENKAAHPADPKPVQQKAEVVSAPRPVQRQTSALISPEPVITQEQENENSSSYSVNIQTSYQDWSTLRVVDETSKRQWTPDEELLIKQVSDQLSQALENAHLFQETQKKAGELATLNQIVQAISEQVELKDVLKATYQEIAKLIPVDTFFVALYDETSKIVSYPIVVDGGDYFEEPDSPLDIKTFSGRTIASGNVVFETIKPEEIASKVTSSTDLGKIGKDYGTLVFLPLKSGVKTIGCISIQSYTFFAYTQEDVSLLENIANQISIGIQNARLYTNSKRTNEELAVLNALSKELTKLLGLNEISELAYKYASQLMDTSAFYICLYNPDMQELSYPFFMGDNEKMDVPPRKLQNGFSEYVIRKNQTLFMPDHIPEHREEMGFGKYTIGNSSDAKCWLGVPMTIDDRVLGAIVVQSIHQENLHTEHHRDLLITIAQQTAISLENSRLFELSQASEANARKRTEELAVLNGLSAELTKLSGIDDISETVFKYASQLMDTRSFFICLINHEKQEISYPYFIGDSEKMEIAPRKPANGLSDYVIRTNQALLISDYNNEQVKELGIDLILVGNSEPQKSWLGVPLSTGSRVFGAIAVQSTHESHLYNEHQRDLLVTIGQQAAVALDNSRLFQETQRNAKELNSLNEMALVLSAETNIENICEITYQYTSKLIDTRSFFIALYEEKTGEIRFPITINNNQRIQNKSRMIGRGGLTDYVIRSKETLFIPENVTDYMEKAGIEFISVGNNRPALSWLGVPLLTGNRAIGAIVVQSVETPNLYTEQERDLLLSVSSQVATSLENARLLEETQRRANEMSALAQIGQEISSSLSIEDVLNKVANSTLSILRCTSTAVYLPDADFTLLNPIATAGEEAVEIKNDPLVIGTGIIGNIALKKVGEINNNVTNDPRATNIKGTEPVEYEHLMAVPILTQENVRGILAVWRVGIGDEFIDSEFAFLSSLAQQIATSLENARLFQDAQERAKELALINRIVSTLTGATNLQEALQSVIYEIVEAYPVARGGITLLDESKLGITVVADHSKVGTASSVGLKVPLEGNIATQTVINTHKPYILENPADNPDSPLLMREEFRRLGVTYTAIFPFFVNDAVIGTVGVDITDQGASLNSRQIDLLETALTPISAAISRLRAEDQLRSSQERYALSSEGANDGLWDWDIASDQIYYSPRWKSMLGFEEHELTRGFEDWEDLIHPDDREYATTALNNYIEQKADAYNVEIRLRHKDGTWRWIRDRGKSLRDANGKAIRMAGTHSDVTERKVAEEAIRRRNDYLAASSEIGKIVTSTLDLNSIFAKTVNLIIERFNFYHASIFIVEETGFNAGLRESTGEAGAEMKKNKHTLQLNDKSVVGKVALGGQAVVVNDVTIDPTHKYNPLLPETRAEAAIPLRIGNRTIGVIDIQAPVVNAFSEDELSVLQTLADQVAVAIDNAKSFELSQQAVMEMREIDRLKSQFLANMSHELRTPLNSIIGFSRVIIKGIDGPVTELQHQDLTAIYNSGQHLLGLINDILDLSKIEAGKMELAFDEVNIADVTSSVLSTMSGLIKDKPIQMKRIIEPNLPTVRADAIRIRQVMINLLTNATKFTEEGDIFVEIGLKPGPTGKKELRVSVTDTGQGISKEDQTKLFQAFSQVDDSPTRKAGGTGLGLSICQHIVNMHGGRIWVDSDVGKGSTFHFTLPFFRKELENENAPGDNRTILAIDDDPQVIGLYERYLQPLGYQVIPLSDPSRAVERVKQLKPFAVTLDIMMPGIDGWQILDNLKSDPETRDTPIIVCSIIDDLEKGFNLGATDYLVKPILEDDIVNALDRLNADGSIREVLVIDDDPDDLRLLGKILTDDGRFKVIFAEGGRMGWDIISSGNPPHAVILDLFMPEMDGFKILENMRASEKLRDIPVIVISGMDISAEQKNQLKEFGQRLLSKGSFNEKELLTSIQRSLERVHAKNK